VVHTVLLLVYQLLQHVLEAITARVVLLLTQRVPVVTIVHLVRVLISHVQLVTIAQLLRALINLALLVTIALLFHLHILLVLLEIIVLLLHLRILPAQLVLIVYPPFRPTLSVLLENTLLPVLHLVLVVLQGDIKQALVKRRVRAVLLVTTVQVLDYLDILFVIDVPMQLVETISVMTVLLELVPTMVPLPLHFATTHLQHPPQSQHLFHHQYQHRCHLLNLPQSQHLFHHQYQHRCHLLNLPQSQHQYQHQYQPSVMHMLPPHRLFLYQLVLIVLYWMLVHLLYQILSLHVDQMMDISEWIFIVVVVDDYQDKMNHAQIMSLFLFFLIQLIPKSLIR